jgi:hypothetical protein
MCQLIGEMVTARADGFGGPHAHHALDGSLRLHLAL